MWIALDLPIRTISTSLGCHLTPPANERWRGPLPSKTRPSPPVSRREPSFATCSSVWAISTILSAAAAAISESPFKPTFSTHHRQDIRPGPGREWRDSRQWSASKTLFALCPSWDSRAAFTRSIRRGFSSRGMSSVCTFSATAIFSLAPARPASAWPGGSALTEATRWARATPFETPTTVWEFSSRKRVLSSESNFPCHPFDHGNFFTST
jgi:hypothetical protein